MVRFSFFTSGSRRQDDGVGQVDVRHLVGEDESEGVILVLGDPVEEPLADVDVAAGMREDIHPRAVEDREGVLHVLAGRRSSDKARPRPPASLGDGPTYRAACG